MNESLHCASCSRKISLEGVKFCPFCGATLEEEPESKARRSAIVGFGDISGFTALSESTDPDELRELIDIVMQRFMAVITGHGGVVDKIIGDAIMFLFGTERSRKDDHIQSLLAVEAIQVELEKFNVERKLKLGIHFGISYGTVSVGRVGTSRTVMGDTVNLAQRLLSAAGTGEVVVSESFAELFGPAFHFQKLESITVKGKKQPVTPYRYVGKVSFKEKLIPMLGREEELAKLKVEMQLVLNKKKARSVMLVAPAGAGKSRIALELSQHFSRDQILFLRINFEEMGLGPEELLKNFLFSLLSIPGLDLRQLPISRELVLNSGFWNHVDFTQLETVSLQALKDVSANRPILIWVEDLHFASPSERQIVARLLEKSSDCPIFWLVTSRQSDEMFGNEMKVAPLTKEKSRELLSLIVDSPNTETKVQANDLDRCGGNPLFISELGRGLNSSVPSEKLFSGSLEILLSSILDSFTEEDRHIIQMASHLGKRGQLEHLSRLTNFGTAELLEKMEKLHLFSYQAETNQFEFRHDLMRSSAYGRTHLDQRKEWHGRLGAIFEGENAWPEVVAFHYLRSSEADKAKQYCVFAARRLSRLPKMEESLTFCREGQKLAKESGDNESLLDLFEIQIEMESRNEPMSTVLGKLKELETELGAGESNRNRIHLLRAKVFFEKQNYEEAQSEIDRATGKKSDRSEMDLKILRTRLAIRMGRHAEAVRTAMEFLRQEKLDITTKAEIFFQLGFVSFRDEEMRPADDFFRKALAAFEQTDNLRGVQKVLILLGNLAHIRNDFYGAKKHFEDVCEISLKFGDMIRYCEGLYFLGVVNFDLLRIKESLSNYSLALDISKKFERRGLMGKIQTALGTAFLRLGKNAQARKMIASAIEALQVKGEEYPLAAALRVDALIDRADGKYQAALRKVEDVLLRVKEIPNQYELAWLLHIELLMDTGDRTKAKEEMSKFERRFSPDHQSQFVRLHVLRIQSELEERKDPKRLEEIVEYLRLTSDYALDLYRLMLVKEALAYGQNPQLLSEKTRLERKIESETKVTNLSHF